MSARRWTHEHGADGLRAKFDVYKHNQQDVSGMYPGYAMYHHANRIGADGEFVFVLRPETDAAAWLALREYAHESEHRAPQLAADIRRELDRIEADNRGAQKP